MPAGLAQKVSASLPSAPPQKILPFVSVILDSAAPSLFTGLRMKSPRIGFFPQHGPSDALCPYSAESLYFPFGGAVSHHWNDTRPSIFYLGFPTIPMAFCNNYLNRLLSGELRITAMTIANLITGLFRKNSNG